MSKRDEFLGRFDEDDRSMRSAGDLVAVLRDRWLLAVVAFLLVAGGVFLLMLQTRVTYKSHAIMHISDEGYQGDELAMIAVVEGRTAVDAEMASMTSWRVAERAADEFKDLHARAVEINADRALELISRAYDVADPACALDVVCLEPEVPTHGRMYRLRFTADGEMVQVLRKHEDEVLSEASVADATSPTGMLVGDQRIRLTVQAGSPAGRDFWLYLRDPEGTAQWLHSGVRVEKVGRRTGLVHLAFDTNDPRWVARAANAIGKAYLSLRKDRRLERLNERGAWIGEKIQETRKELDDALTARDEYIKDSQAVLLSDKARAAADNIALLTTQRFEHEQRLFVQRSALTELKAGGDPLFFLSSEGAASDPLVQALADRLSVLRIERRTVGEEFTEESSRIKALDAQIAAGEKLLDERNEYLRERVVAMMNRRITALEKRIDRIDGEVEKHAGVLERLPEQERRLAGYEREVQVHATSLQFLQRKQEETSIAIKSVPANAEMIEPASPASSPARSLLIRALVAAIVLGLLVGVVVALIRHLRDDAVRDPMDLERATGLKLYAAIPDFRTVRRRDRRGVKGSLVARDAPHGILAEAYRTLRANLRFSEDGERVRSLTVTSALPSEGKTTTTLNLATVMAQGGSSVVVVDADLRRSTVHEHLGGARTPGLTDVLTGNAELDAVVRSTDVERFDFIPAGAEHATPAALLESEAFRTLLATLEERYDYVLFDVPPVLSVLDAASFFRALDGVLLLNRAGRAPGAVVDGAREQVERLGGRTLGVILNGYDAKRASRRRYAGGQYGYYGYYGYYGRDSGGKSGGEASS